MTFGILSYKRFYMKSSLEKLFEPFRYHFDIPIVFTDFLTMAICAVSRNVGTGLSYEEELYLKTIAPYKDSALRFEFPKIFAALITEMESRKGSSAGNDVLGEFYELSIAKRGSGQFFTPWHVCKLMATITYGPSESNNPLRILDPACGSGRMLLAGSESLGSRHEFYGIDVDHTCVQMAVLNLFLNGVFNAEIMCANALAVGDFRVSYVTSLFPLGIFRITEKEKSELWHLYQHSPNKDTVAKLILPSDSSDNSSDRGSQLQLF